MYLQLGGQMPLPHNISDLRNIIMKVNSSTFLEKCFGAFWIPLKRSEYNKSNWESVFFASQDHIELPWAEGEPDGAFLQHNCVGASQETLAYYDVDCNWDLCFICQFEEERIFKLKGLCSEQTLVDSDYIYLSNQITFKGLLGRTNIILNENMSSWDLMYSQYNSERNGSLGYLNDSQSKKFPLGAFNWNINFHCHKMNTNFTSAELKLTKVLIILN